MNRKLLSITLLFVLIASAFCEVVQLSEANFDEEIAKCDVAIVTFYAPWCGHCKKWHEPFEELALRLQTTGVCAFTVDATENRDLSGRFEIRGVPSILAFTGQSSNPVKYTGQRTVDAVYEWVMSF
ncbi:Protein disulfide isomerase [Carpediemonas membranifera]|uniref:Protein disulfide isomerase n=1 Tax=Carpediemonas membranifera TaxID=201153 RepID=A0A8J6E1U3_9EUKA|nr:Protein disulfide isomerase [Carpediemonas membranifera]|eukprot:KAG9393893.1 Protein disulfide isomerase [Carpediemonas membranifera]